MKRISLTLGVMGSLGAAVFGVGCDGLLPCEDTPGCRVVFPTAGSLDDLYTGTKLGEDCSNASCREGLQCVEGRCEVSMSAEAGERCAIGAECKEGLTCFVGPCPIEEIGVCPVCVDAGAGQVGDGCQTDVDCEAGLRCGLVGFSGQCLEGGQADIGQECQLQTDCQQGLFCTEGACSLTPPFFEGVECPKNDETDIIAHFSVPGAPDTPENADYFQFPFPNDFRLGDDGRPDLGDFPTPGPGLLGVDIVERYIDAIEAHADGFSTSPSIIFRFSGLYDGDSFKSDSEKGFRGVNIVDVDALPDDPEEGVRHHSSRFLYFNNGATNYVCGNWFAVRSPSDTLIPGHRYVVLLKGGKQENGSPILQDPQFSAMLKSSAPSDPALKKAHAAHAPLRELIDFYKGSSHELSPNEITVATVFTAGEVIDPMRELAKTVGKADVPKASDWVKCGGGASSPCDQSEESEGRACGSGTEDYDEYQALLELPIFQEGEAPYLDEGGAISNKVERTEKVCMSLALPKSAPPSEGFPLVVYGHGTGGSYRSHLSATVAGRLSAQGVASLGFDQVQHGPRRGDGEGADQDPDNLFFNFVNPDAARGNPLQGAADVLSVLRFVAQGDLADASDTGAEAISIDPDRIVLYGHSQGSTHSSMALPFSDLPGAVLSGNGGGLAEALMNKTNPVNIAGAIPFVVQDADDQGQLRMGDKHPVLSLLQHYIDPADPVNFAALLAARPEEGQGLKSVFQTFGLDDTYSPPATLARYVHATELMALASPAPGVNAQGDNDLGMSFSTDPISLNVSTEGDAATLVCRQYAPVNDGHFVADEVSEANDDVIGFLGALVDGVAPTVPAP